MAPRSLVVPDANHNPENICTLKMQLSWTMLIALMKLKGFGRRRALEVIRRTPTESSAEACVDAMTSSVQRLYPAEVSPAAISNAWSKSEDELARTIAAGISIAALHDEHFPDRLRHIPNPPAILYAMGSLNAMRVSKSLAVVGTQKPTPYGEIVARRSAAVAVEQGFSIVSGLARGCDTHAHIGCVESSGTGVAVLGSGLDKLFPASNQELADLLVEHGGCLVSEYPLGARPTKWSFAERDRIQSGLADAVLVIETDVVGGTMHTVGYARQQKRPLACIVHPGRYRDEPKTKGNQKLQSEGGVTPISSGSALNDFLGGTLCAQIDGQADLLVRS